MTECPAYPGEPRCPESICDCFIDTHPDDPLGLHPEDFVVMGRCVVVNPADQPVGADMFEIPDDLLTDLLTEDHTTEAKDCE